MAIKKTATAEVADIISFNAWEQMHGSRSFRAKTASAGKVAGDQSKYLLSHCTIMASVQVEEEPFDFFIKPEAAHLVNNNQDAWTNEVLKLSYRTFIGAFNFLEHYQNSKHSKGHILDTVLRKVKLTPDSWVYYCDILVATELVHEKLIGEIRSGKVKYMSMGCLCDVCICSFCGARVTDPSTSCEHLLHSKGDFMFDDDGIPRRVAELCGHKSLPGGGVKFVEASWVGTPAFPGAANRTIITEEWTGPKTPFTTKAASAELAKAKTASRLVEDPKLDARFKRLFD